MNVILRAEQFVILRAEQFVILRAEQFVILRAEPEESFYHGEIQKI